jgi:predicted O-methyltransferase YrrM
MGPLRPERRQPMQSSDLAMQFPIESQTSDSDKSFLLGVVAMLRGAKGSYDYLEIGSFLGGSLAPFLRDAACRSVVSIDDREKIQPDERGASFDYRGVSVAAMLDKLRAAGLDTAKLHTFDGSIENWTPGTARFDLAFIDGEHTDIACFRDFLWTFPLMRENAIVMFHDSTLIHKAIRILLVYLESRRVNFSFVKGQDSEMSCLIFGAWQAPDIERRLGPLEDPGDFFSRAEMELLHMQIENRAEFNLNGGELRFSVKMPPVHKMG